MGTPYATVANRFAVDASVSTISDFDSGSEQYEFLSESLMMRQTHVDSLGIRGTRSRVKDHVRIGMEDVGGSISFAPTPVELDKWIPRILGGTETADSFPLAETLPEFGILVDRGAERGVYTGCKVSRAVFAGSPGQLVTLSMDIVGKAGGMVSGAWPGTIPAIDTGQPYVFSDLTFALAADASAAQMLGFRITIDNFVQRRFANSVTAVEVYAADRLITFEADMPYTADEVDLFAQAVAGGTGTLTLTNGNQSTLFSFANLKVPNEDPITGGRGSEMTGTLRMVAYMSGSTRELVITHDSTA